MRTQSQNSYRRSLYRSRDGVILGVCRGLADYFDISTTWIRLLAVFIFFVSGLWPVIGLYLIAALIMKPEPVIPLHSDEEQAFYEGYVHSRTGTLHSLYRRFKNLERRIRRMEDVVTSKEYDWNRRFRS